ncbi:hypothetical protein DRH29_03065 [candidate division Kazan bacterium]|uniref:Uncharacterized protein n=1 Tax=candidate division Kazan bacterium TaxID=2202143 RepID=A0A420ZCC7_UNCK3|nr:MAG: hypothetical protein DRH29_03065 [candidate division Kazan bacterium]
MPKKRWIKKGNTWMEVELPEDEIYKCSTCLKEECEHIYWKTKLHLDRKRNSYIKWQVIILSLTAILSLIAIVVGLK